MLFETYTKIVVDGFLIGIVYALIAIGLSISFGVMRIVNFAHGELVVIGMYIHFWLLSLAGVPTLAAVPVAAAALFVIGFALQRFVVDRIMAQQDHIQFILFIAVALIITGGHLVLFGPNARGLTTPESLAVYKLAGLRLDAVVVQAALGAIVLILGLVAFLRFTMLGKAIRACASNRTGAQVIGIRIRHVFAVTAGIGAALAGAAGALIAPLYDTHPYLAPEFTLLAFIIVIIGGLGSLTGAFIGGVMIGVSEAVAAFIVSPSLKSVFSYALLTLVILFRPAGLVGRR